MMFKSVILAASALAATVPALPHFEDAKQIMVRQSNAELEPLANWQALNFEEGCSAKGCVAGFNLTAEVDYYPGSPGFIVYCRPVFRETWSLCEVIGALRPESSVEAQWTDASSDDLVRLAVANIWREGEARYNASGWIEIKPDTKDFDFPVLQITGGL